MLLSIIIFVYLFILVSTWQTRGLHTKSEINNFEKMDVHVLAALKDNYMYLVNYILLFFYFFNTNCVIKTCHTFKR